MKIIINTNKDNLIIKITDKPKKILHLPKLTKHNDCTIKEIEKVLIWTNI